MECAVCLEKCVHPVRLPCGHVFCFLCMKGFVIQTKRCAMCRQEVSKDFIVHPNLLELHTMGKSYDVEGYYWFYEGRNGKQLQIFNFKISS